MFAHVKEGYVTCARQIWKSFDAIPFRFHTSNLVNPASSSKASLLDFVESAKNKENEVVNK